MPGTPDEKFYDRFPGMPPVEPLGRRAEVRRRSTASRRGRTSIRGSASPTTCSATAGRPSRSTSAATSPRPTSTSPCCSTRLRRRSTPRTARGPMPTRTTSPIAIWATSGRTASAAPSDNQNFGKSNPNAVAVDRRCARGLGHARQQLGVRHGSAARADPRAVGQRRLLLQHRRLLSATPTARSA